MQFTLQPVRDQILWEMRHKSKCHILNGQIASCGKCTKHVLGPVQLGLVQHVSCYGSREHTGKEEADETYSLQRMQTTTFENDLSASISHLRPATLYGKNGKHGKLAALKDGFGACETYDRWVGGFDLYRTALTGQLKTYCEGVKEAYPKKTGGGAMARKLILGVRSQWGELMTFVDTFYIELTMVAKFPPTQAWALVG
jgi:hypothetical protein